MLAELMRFRHGMPLPGRTENHNDRDGVQCLCRSGLDPTFVNGGLVKAADVHARLGHLISYLIAGSEMRRRVLPAFAADGRDRRNIEADHMDTYPWRL